MDRFIAEALRDPPFARLWSCETDPSFRSYASAALAFAHVDRLPSGARASLYREIATGKRFAVLDRLSGLDGWQSRTRLLPKVVHPLFREPDWRALFEVSAEPAIRRALAHLEEISPILVHQVSRVPGHMLLPRVLAVLNGLDVSADHWDRLSEALLDVPPQRRPFLAAKARTVTSTGSFWDHFFECVDRPWAPFRLPDRFQASPMLKPLGTTQDLRRAGLRMKNCLASRAGNIRAGREIYFEWQGARPATVQFVNAGGWRLGQILGVGNRHLPQGEIEAIRRCASLLLVDPRCDMGSNVFMPNPTIRALCDRTRKKFGLVKCNEVAAALRAIRQHDVDPDSDERAFCIVEAGEGYVQFLYAPASNEYLCEIQSHHYHAPVEERLTDAAVALITGAGFVWPRGEENFARWFTVDTDPEIDDLAALSLGLLGEIFGHEPGGEATTQLHLPRSWQPARSMSRYVAASEP